MKAFYNLSSTLEVQGLIVNASTRNGSGDLVGVQRALTVSLG